MYVSLHDHLDGGVRLETLAASLGRDKEDLQAELAGYTNSGSLVEYLKAFEATCSVMQTVKMLEQVAYEAVMDLYFAKVILAEFRFCPFLHTSNGLHPAQVVEAVDAGLARGVAACMGNISVGLILSSLRHLDQSEQMAALFKQYFPKSDSFVCGVDLAGPEEGYLPSAHKGFAKLKAEFGGKAPITIHAGEVGSVYSMEDALKVGASRLGHATAISKASDAFMEKLANNHIHLEFCITSNIQTGAIANQHLHPVAKAAEFGISFSCDTDNRLMSDTTNAKEMEIMSQILGYNPKVQVLVNSIQASFVKDTSYAIKMVS